MSDDKEDGAEVRKVAFRLCDCNPSGAPHAYLKVEDEQGTTVMTFGPVFSKENAMSWLKVISNAHKEVGVYDEANALICEQAINDSNLPQDYTAGDSISDILSLTGPLGSLIGHYDDTEQVMQPLNVQMCDSGFGQQWPHAYIHNVYGEKCVTTRFSSKAAGEHLIRKLSSSGNITSEEETVLLSQLAELKLQDNPVDNAERGKEELAHFDEITAPDNIGELMNELRKEDREGDYDVLSIGSVTIIQL